jgi:plastocyanin
MVKGQDDTPGPAPTAAASEPAATSPEPAATRTSSASPPKRSAAVATVTGTVKVKGANGPAYVFLADVKGAPATGSIEIRQQDKQFYPRTAVVPRGTKITFPNYDSIFHNVFSVSVGNEFDLGSARKGDPVKSYVVNTPGVIEIFCNMHSRMSSTVLVTPSNIFTRVAADGTFKLEGVPLGTRKISAWAGGNSLVTESVEVGAGGGQVQLALDVADSGPHKNKAGQAYGSYDD